MCVLLNKYWLKSNSICKNLSVLQCMSNIALLEYTFFFLWRCDPTRVMASSFLRFLDHTQRRSTVGRTPLDKWSARRRDLYLTTHNTHNRQISMPPVGFKPTISAGKRPQTYALDRAATGTGTQNLRPLIFIITLINAHIISVKLYYTCSNMFRCPRTVFRELIGCVS